LRSGAGERVTMTAPSVPMGSTVGSGGSGMKYGRLARIPRITDVTLWPISCVSRIAINGSENASAPSTALRK